MTSPAYRLSKHAYVCLADDRLVFSDIRDDMYRCLDKKNTQAALRLFPDFQGLDKPPISETPATTAEETELVVRELSENGLLAEGGAAGKTFAPVRVSVPTSSILSDNPAPIPRPHVGHWASFLQASLKASGKLRLQSLRRTIQSVENRKRRRSDASSQDSDVLRELVAIFHHLRPYYVRRYLCRFDSLALVEFLAHYDQFPQWVFGVRSEPFGAHCWVQHEDCLLNESIDYVSHFTPIMAF